MDLKNSDNKTADKFEFLQKNHAWIVTIMTLITVALSYVLKFAEYIVSSYYFSYFGLNITLYKYNDLGFTYYIVFSIILQLVYFSIIYCFKQVKDDFKNFKNKWSKIIGNLVFIVISNFILLLYLGVTIKNLISYLLIIFILEIIIVFLDWLLNKLFPLKDGNQNNTIVDFIKKIPVIIILLTIILGTITYYKLINVKIYQIIDNNKAVIYSNNDYFLVLDCKIDEENNKLILYKGKQTKISNTDIHTEKFEFKEVKLR